MLLRWLYKESIEHGHGIDEIESRLQAATERPNFLRDAVYGGIDGAVTTFAIVAGVEGAGFDQHIVVALGIANVLSDGFSMAASNYSGIRADSENVARLRAMEKRHIQDYPEGERLEIATILKSKGLTGKSLDDAVSVVTSHERLWLDMMLVDEYGVSPIPAAPVRAALITFASFVLCGFVPLLPFLLKLENAFDIAIGATAFIFFMIGSIKSRWSLIPWWKSAIQTLSIGAAAAIIAWSAAVFVTHLG